MFGLGGWIAGVLVLLWGIFMVFFFPAFSEHQGELFGRNGVIFGFFLLFVGILLVFF